MSAGLDILLSNGTGKNAEALALTKDKDGDGREPVGPAFEFGLFWLFWICQWWRLFNEDETSCADRSKHTNPPILC
jgi:hypothetical protein